MFMRVFAGVLLSFCFAFSSWAAEAGKGISIFIAYTGTERIGKQVLEMLGRMRNEHISHITSDQHKKYVIRSLRKGETDLLKDFLYEAIFIPKGAEPPAWDIIEKPELRVYTDGFATRKGDNCLVADFGGKVVGAV